MSYPPDPNNPYGQPPAAPGYGYPQQAPPPQAAYGYPQQAPAYGQPAPGYGQYGYQPMGVPQSMPGLMVTARVLLFIVGGTQVLGALFCLLGAMATKGAMSQSKSTDEGLLAIGDAAAGVLAVVGVVAALAAALSITLGVKFGKGGNSVRVTTIVYGVIGGLIGLLGLVSSFAATTGQAANLVVSLLWIGISVIWITGVCTKDAVTWFNRPKY
ncbi:hypothetical protein [Kitasatospora brasiliensis]|uniref:hypothetical protein n=1 Tax=Kitasatospora brasiliensis TaxID=3058040 RepID=UPI002930D60C|nr:hypothetical protein [Kitasatospora sp. K002]